MTLADITLFGNNARQMGGLYNLAGTATINNSTFADNDAVFSGGGLYNGATLLLQNIIAANSSANGSSGGDCFSESNPNSTVTTTYSMIEDGNCGAGAGTGNSNLNSDPLLAPLADNGGPTETHALLAGGPAIDMGEAATCLAADQRGFSRSGISDLGAYEAEGIPTAVRLRAISTVTVKIPIVVNLAALMFILSGRLLLWQ